MWVYENPFSWKTRGIIRENEIIVAAGAPILVGDIYMVPIEGGGSIPNQFTTAVTRPDLQLNKDLVVIEIGSGRRYSKGRKSGCKYTGRAYCHKVRTRLSPRVASFVFLLTCAAFVQRNQCVASPDAPHSHRRGILGGGGEGNPAPDANSSTDVATTRG